MAETTNHRFDKDQEEFLFRILMPTRKMNPSLRSYHKYLITKGSSYRNANLKISGLAEKLHHGEFKFAADDDEIRSLAEKFSTRYSKITAGTSAGVGLAKSSVKEDIGVDLPKNTNLPRLSCPKFWRKSLRRHALRQVEQVNRLMGRTRKTVSPYISRHVAHSWFERNKCNRALLEAMEAENDFGQVFTLAELSDLGVSNPINRRNELMTRLDGFDRYGIEDDANEWVTILYTMTCPSYCHPTSNNRPNPKYRGATPIEAQEWLNQNWKRARTAYGKLKIKVYGFRIAEPHHDGTPHWHVLLWVPKHQEQQLTAILRHYAFSENGNERGALKHRFDAVKIDPKKGRATGYIAKYIAKNIDGFGVDFDYEAEQPSAIAAVHARIWASVWGIRQFQQIGGPPVTVYRECRKIASNIESIYKEPSELDREIIEAANVGDWCAFTIKMGGVVCPRDARPLRPAHFPKECTGYYGDILLKLVGLWSYNQPKPIAYSKPNWVIRHKISGAGLATEQATQQAPPASALEFCQ